MRFGIHLPNSGPLAAEANLVELAVEAERLGFSSVWVYDHLFNPVELSPATRETRDSYYNLADMPYYDALTLLSVIAGATNTIGLGTRVLLPVLRSPVVLAKQLGTLEVLAGEGRLVVGVGAGWLLEEYDAVGLDHRERFARLDEHVEVMRRIWSEGITEHDGTFYRHPPAGFLPVPDAPIPVLLGGGGPKTIERVARWADGWAMPNVDPGPDARETIEGLLEQLHAACDRVGRDPASVRLVAGAPLSADHSHFELLAAMGIDDVDVMLTRGDELDMAAASDFAHNVAPQFT